MALLRVGRGPDLSQLGGRATNRPPRAALSVAVFAGRAERPGASGRGVQRVRGRAGWSFARSVTGVVHEPTLDLGTVVFDDDAPRQGSRRIASAIASAAASEPGAAKWVASPHSSASGGTTARTSTSGRRRSSAMVAMSWL